MTRELAHRQGDGMDITLLWSEDDGALRVVVEDWRTGETFEVPAHPENALEVFNHPYRLPRPPGRRLAPSGCSRAHLQAL